MARVRTPNSAFDRTAGSHALAAAGQRVLEERTQYGQEYAIRATLVGPSGSSADVTSVWIVRTGEDFPRFVTAYPEDLR